MADGRRAEDREVDRSYMRDFVVRLRFENAQEPRRFMVRSTTVRGALARALDAERSVLSADEGRLLGAEIFEAPDESADR